MAIRFLSVALPTESKELSLSIAQGLGSVNKKP